MFLVVKSTRDFKKIMCFNIANIRITHKADTLINYKRTLNIYCSNRICLSSFEGQINLLTYCEYFFYFSRVVYEIDFSLRFQSCYKLLTLQILTGICTLVSPYHVNFQFR